MALPVAVAVAVSVIVAAPAVINGIKDILDSLGFDRSCIIEFVNATDEPLRMTVAETESGAFHDPPRPEIAPRSSMIFTAGSRFVGEGNSGHTTTEGNGVTIFMDWSNPFIGSNDLDVTITGPRAAEFGAVATAGGGETGAMLRCTFYYADVSRYEAGLSQGVPHGGWAPETEDYECKAAAGQFRVPLPEAVDRALAGGGERIRLQFALTERSGRIRTGRSERLVREADGNLHMTVNECENGRRVAQWTVTITPPVFGSYLLGFEIPDFDSSVGPLGVAYLNETGTYTDDDGSAIGVIGWQIPHI
ncbi:MAG: hypothetical protein M3422_22745 [Actinomycetota bacterium]|nr:hypothetical protein [Actinomycetota bacterium]